MLSQAGATTQTGLLLQTREKECGYLDTIRSYWKGRQPLPMLPTGTPLELRTLANMSRINIVELVIDVLGQSLYVDGFRSTTDSEQAPAWDIWQANKMDARQTGVHRTAFAYGTSYVLTLPGDPVPVFRGISPRYMTTLYGEDPDWPMVALEVIYSNGRTLYRLYDDQAIYYLDEDEEGRRPGQPYNPRFLSVDDHSVGVCPVTRFVNEIDLDDDDPGIGEIDTLIPLQNQMDVTTLGLLVTQHYQSFKQRYILGWTSAEEAVLAKAAASTFLTFKDSPDDIKVGEFTQADLSGYLDSRQAEIDIVGMLSQTPPGHLLGKLVNLAADALAAAESGHQRKITERETLFGEAWEQTLNLGAQIAGQDIDQGAQVRWRDTEARALASTVDALGKMAQMLGVPVQMLWEQIPGWTDQDVEKAKALAADSDSFAQLNALLDKQAGAGGGTTGGGNPGAPAA